jgi:tetratricopeptide (TPR) repeat protein
VVARRLVAAELEEDPERSYAQAQVARDLAARVGVVREVTGLAAYRAGKWAEALSELRAARRLTGKESFLPVMADSERAMGRLDRALALVHSPEAGKLTRAGQIELLIVESGIRRDEGRPEAAVIVLQVPELTDGKVRAWSGPLYYAYADALLAAGREDEAREWFEQAAAADPDGETDAADRVHELGGMVLEDLEDFDDEEFVDQALADEAPVDQELGDEDPADDESSDGDEPAEEDLVDKASADEAPTDEAPADDEPSDDDEPADEELVDEASADEAPADREASDAEPVTDGPSAEEPRNAEPGDGEALADSRPDDDQPDSRPAAEPAKDEPEH